MSRSRFGYGALGRLAWPVVLSRSAQAVIGFSDALMTASLGEDALAATTAGSMNVMSLAILPIGTAFIVQSFASQLAGKGDVVGARRYGWYGLVLAALAGLVFAGVVPLVPGALSHLNYAPAVRAAMSDYLCVRLLSVAAIVGIEAIGNWYAGLGNTRYGMVAALLTMVCNVGLNWLLIEGNAGAPALGVTGAAWASVLASVVGFAVLLILFVARTGIPQPESPAPSTAADSTLGEFWKMLRFGIPNGLNWFLEFAAFMFFVNVVVADLGTVATAALLATVQVNSLSFMPAFGLSSAGAILVGQAIGAEKQDEVPSILRRTLSTTCAWQLSVGVLYLLFPGPIMSLFSPDGAGDTAEIVIVGASALALSAAWQLFDAINMSVSEALRAAGDTAFSLYARLTVAWLLFVPGSYFAITVYGGGPSAAILAVVAYFAVLSAVMGWRFRTGRWRDIQLTG
ncbi:MAG: MATE family efflux transporter [Nannocystales bacterium]